MSGGTNGKEAAEQPPISAQPLRLEAYIHRVLHEARAAKMSERDPHYRFLVALMSLSHQAQLLSQILIESTQSFKSEIAQAKTVRAETESFEASSGAFQLGIPMARALVLCFVISIAMAGLGGYLLGYSEVFGSRHTTVDRLRHEFGIDELSAQIWTEIIPRNDLRLEIPICKGYRSQIENGRRYCDIKLFVSPPAPNRGP